MLAVPTQTPNSIAVINEPGVPTMKYTISQTKTLIRDLETKRDRAKQCRDKHAHRFFSQWVLELKVAVVVSGAEIVR